jgi:hypothetical protein
MGLQQGVRVKGTNAWEVRPARIRNVLPPSIDWRANGGARKYHSQQQNAKIKCIRRRIPMWLTLPNTNQSQHHGKTENQWVHLGVQALLGSMIRHQYINWKVLCVLGEEGFISDERADMFAIASHRLCRLYAFTYMLRIKPLYILLNTYKCFRIRGLRPLRSCRL